MKYMVKYLVKFIVKYTKYKNINVERLNSSKLGF